MIDQMIDRMTGRPRALLAIAALSALACDPVSRLHGSVRTPERPIAGVQIQVVCPLGVFRRERRVVGTPSPAVSDDKGEFTITLAGFDTVPDRCMLRVQMPDGARFETVIGSLEPQKDPEQRTARVKIVPPDVTRLPSPPPPPASP
jgi:hypothetical protein